jgi:Na+-transporting NADH:ubiquinone oxidoreductase subunit NqrE
VRRRRGARLDLRYRILDEPGTPPLARIAIPPLVLIPITLYLALSYSVFFFLLPGLNGLLVWGNHKWRDIGLSFLALVLFIAAVIAKNLLADAQLISGLGQEYAKDLALALGVFPLIKVMFDQYYTLSLRRALGGMR